MIQLISENVKEDEINLMPFIQRCALDTIVETSMGVQINAQLDSNQPYVKAVGSFNALALTYWKNPFYAMFNGLLWKLSGYKAQVDEALDVLKSTSRKVRSRIVSNLIKIYR
jgi:hypothetical protein